MRSAQFTLREIISLFRRRKQYFFIPVILITVLSIVGAILLPNKYESSTTILVQRDEILNPLLGYEIAVAMASEDRLRTFNEIIFSRTTIQRLIDSLGMSQNVKTEEQRQALIEAVIQKIETEKRGPDSFRITFTDTDPERTQHAVGLLSSLFIETIMQVESQRNEQAVQFFEKKLEEIRQKFEASQKEVVLLLGKRINTLPTETRVMYTQLEGIEKQLNEVDLRIAAYQQALAILRTSPKGLNSESGKQSLYDLQRFDIPYAQDLRTLLSKYDDYLRRYTAQYPEVQKLEQQIPELIDRMHNAVESELGKQQSLRWDIEKKRTQLVDDIKQSSISERVGEDKESDYTIYRKLYDEMKVKLEQARTSRDLGHKSANQFLILDPPPLPTHPSKPNRTQIVLGGLGIGMILGFLAVILKEMLDTTIRIPKDIEVYQKPVIAFITEGQDENYD